MKYFVLVGFMLFSIGLFAQTTTVSSGNWSDGSIWSTGAVPLTTATVNINNSITIDQDVVVTTGTYNFGASGGSDEFISDLPGGSAHTLTAVTAGGTLNFLDGITTFEGAVNFDNNTITIAAGATLIIGISGGTSDILTVNNGTTFTVNGTLIIYGNFINNNNGSGILTINNGGLVQIYGNYDANSLGAVDINGGGDLFTTGYIKTQGSSDVFGNTNECNVGPCSGRNLCGWTLSISSNQVVCNSGALNASTPTVLTSTTTATGTLTYRWQRAGSIGGFTNGAALGTPPGSLGTATPTTGLALANAPNTNTGSTYVIDPSYYDAAETNYFRVHVFDSNTGCGASSSSVVLVSVGSSGWRGTTSDWSLNTNWCNNLVPTSASPATVTIAEFPTGAGAFYPVISTSGVSSIGNVRNLIISSGARVTLDPSSTLNIFGNLTDNGTLSASATSTVDFVGTSAQTIGGNSNTNFGNLTINNANGVSIATNNRTVSGALNLTQGNVNLAGLTLTVGSSPTSTGSLSRTNGWFYGGNLQRYFGTAATSLANGLFPLGLSTTDYRPFALSYNSALSSGGYVRVAHSGTRFTSTDVNFLDGAFTVQRISQSFWTVSQNGITIPVSTTPFTIEAGGTSFSDPAVLTDFRLTRLADVVGVNGTTSGSVTDPRIQRTSLTAANLNNTFYVGTINAAATPLPISLISFNANRKEAGVELLWKTLTEENLDFFEIERSSDGKDFISLGKVQGSGNSKEEREYKLFDEKVLIGKNYYRLKSVDFDGYTEYFNVVMVDFNGSKAFSISPNPADGITFTAETNFVPVTRAFIVIYSTIGSEIARYEVSGDKSQLSLPVKLETGIYYAKYISSDFTATNRVVVK